MSSSVNSPPSVMSLYGLSGLDLVLHSPLEIVLASLHELALAPAPVLALALALSFALVRPPTLPSTQILRLLRLRLRLLLVPPTPFPCKISPFLLWISISQRHY